MGGTFKIASNRSLCSRIFLLLFTLFDTSFVPSSVQHSLSLIRSILPWLPCPASAVSMASRAHSQRILSTSDCSKRHRTDGLSFSLSLSLLRSCDRGLHRRQFRFTFFPPPTAAALSQLATCHCSNNQSRTSAVFSGLPITTPIR